MASRSRRHMACLPCGRRSPAWRAWDAGIVGRDLPEIGPTLAQGPARAARLEPGPQQQHQIGTDRRMAIEVRMAKKAGGHPRIDELGPRHPFEVLALLVRQVFRAQLAHAAKTRQQEAREANGPVGVRDVEGRPLHPQAHVLGRQPLGDHLQVEVGGGQHDILDAVDGAEIFPLPRAFRCTAHARRWSGHPSPGYGRSGGVPPAPVPTPAAARIASDERW